MKAKTKQPFLQRSRMEIIACLLNNSYHGSRKTRLVYSCNLSVSQFNKYVAYLIEGELLRKRIEENGVEVYSITDKGIGFLKDYEKIQKTLEKMKL
jgi:predicted transcriptional regulator